MTYINDPKIDVSVCVCFFNVEKYLIKFLDSLFNQTIDKDIEYVFVDDGSLDDSHRILDSYLENIPSLKKQNVKVVHNDSNKGLSASRNIALKNSNGKYVTFVDADDWLECNYLEELYDSAENSAEGVDVVYCNYILEYKKTSIVKRLNRCSTPQELLDFEFSSGQSMVWGKLFIRELFVQNNIFWNENINMHEDLYITTMLLQKAKNISFVDKPLYHYVKYNMSSMTNDEFITSSKNNVILVSSEIEKSLGSDKSVTKSSLDAMKLEILINAVMSAGKKDRHRFYDLFPEIKITSVFRIKKWNKIVFSIFYLLHLYFITDCLIFVRNWYVDNLNRS